MCLGALALGALALGPLAPGVWPAGPGGGRSAPADTLVIAMGTEIVQLDPHEITDTPAATVAHHLYDTLVSLDARLQPVPHLAAGWQTSADGRIWQFDLRPGVRFHDGTALDAAAAARSFARLLDPRAARARRSLLAPYVAEVRAVGLLRLEFELHRPYGGLLYHLAHGAAAVVLAPPPDSERFRARARQIPPGTGPFRLVRHLPGQEVALERNPFFWGDAPPLGRLIFRPVPDAAGRALLLQAGAADVALPLAAGDVRRLADHPRVRTVALPSQRLLYLGINVRRPPLDQAPVRQALHLSIDRTALAERLLLGLAQPAAGPVPAGTWGYRSLPGAAHDPAAARQALAAAGVAPGAPLLLWTPEGRYMLDRQLAEAVAGYLSAAGFRVQVQRWEWGAYLAALNRADLAADLFLLGWVPGTGEALSVLRPLFHSASRANHGGYANSRVDALIEQAEAAADAERALLLGRLQEEIARDAAIIPLLQLWQTVGLGRAVEGVQIFPTELVSFRSARKSAR